MHTGEFEVLRYTSKKPKLIDPVNTDKFRTAYKMESEQIKKYLGPNMMYKSLEIDGQDKRKASRRGTSPLNDNMQKLPNQNNSLYVGKSAQLKNLRIMIAG